MKTCANPECPNEFDPSPKKRYCSAECTRRARYLRLKASIGPRSCEYCGNEFTPSYSEGSYCSIPCSNRARKIDRSIQQGKTVQRELEARCIRLNKPAFDLWRKVYGTTEEVA